MSFASRAEHIVVPNVEGTNAAYAIRYICVIGLALLIADYIGSFKHERELVWKAPPCIMKYGFLLNRYLIPACLIAIFIPLSGFLGLNFTDSECQWFVDVVAVVLATCVVIDCCITASRLSVLWDAEKSMSILVAVIAVASYVPHIAGIVVALNHMKSYIVWNPLLINGLPLGLNMCIATKVSPWLIGGAAAPLLFEIFMIFVIVFKLRALPRAPRGTEHKQTVARYGLIYFVAIATLRVLHLALAATLDPALVLIGLLSIAVTSLLSILANYKVLSSRAAGMAEHARRAAKAGVVPPTPATTCGGAFARRPRQPSVISTLEDPSTHKGGWYPTDSPIELGRVQVQVEVEEDAIRVGK